MLMSTRPSTLAHPPRSLGRTHAVSHIEQGAAPPLIMCVGWNYVALRLAAGGGAAAGPDPLNLILAGGGSVGGWVLALALTAILTTLIGYKRNAPLSPQALVPPQFGHSMRPSHARPSHRALATLVRSHAHMRACARPLIQRYNACREWIEMGAPVEGLLSPPANLTCPSGDSLFSLLSTLLYSLRSTLYALLSTLYSLLNSLLSTLYSTQLSTQLSTLYSTQLSTHLTTLYSQLSTLLNSLLSTTGGAPLKPDLLPPESLWGRVKGVLHDAGWARRSLWWRNDKWSMVKPRGEQITPGAGAVHV